MEGLLSAFEYLLVACGTWGVALLVCLIVFFFMQLWYWLVRYGRVPSYRNTHRSEEHPPVSVVVILHAVDYNFLEETLPVLMGQECEKFELVVADLSGDVEFGEALTLLADNNPKFSVTRMVRDSRFPISNKMALNVAIKAAAYENIIITTVESCPVSDQWLARMARGFADNEIVIGYCGMEQSTGFANRMIRIDRAGSAMRWIAAAMRGKPYRGTIHNIGFTKRLYFENGGFNYLNMNMGEDDLFMQKLLATASASVVVSQNSLVRQKVWGGLRWWYTLRKFYSNSFRYYPNDVKRYIGTELQSRFLFFVLVVISVVLLPLEVKLFALSLLLVRFLIILFEMRRILLRLSEKGLMKVVLLYDIVTPFYEAWMAVARSLRPSPGLWR